MKVNRLDGVATNEVSLVRRGANNKRIAVKKGHETMQSIQDVLATEAEGEVELRESLVAKGLDAEAVEAAAMQFRLQAGFADKLDADALSAVSKAAGYDVEKMDHKRKMDMEDKKKMDSKRKMDMDDDKDEDDMDKMDDKKKGMKKSFDEDAQKMIDGLIAENAKLAKSFEDFAAEQERKDLIEKAKREYAFVPGLSAEDIADQIITAKSVNEKHAAALEANFKRTSEALSKSQALSATGALSVGTSAITPAAGAWGQIKKAASTIVEKSADVSADIAEAQAIRKSLLNDPSLYERYLEENPAQINDQSR